MHINPFLLRTTKTLWSFGCSECNKVQYYRCTSQYVYTKKSEHHCKSTFLTAEASCTICVNILIQCNLSIKVAVVGMSAMERSNTVELQWLEHLWDYENLFETGVVRAIEGLL